MGSLEEIVKKLKNIRPIQRRIPYNNSDPNHKPTSDDLEQAPMVTVGYRADCPAHQDNARALVVNEVKNQGIQFHCSRGCTYGKIMEALGLAEVEA